MTSSTLLGTLLLLLLHQACSEEAEPLLRAQGSSIEMGYCFGVDYIVVYRSSPDGDQLLGNSSASGTPLTPTADLRGRVHINQYMNLLGLEIRDLTGIDSGIYKRECWQEITLVSQLTHRLFVCDEEVGSEEIVVMQQEEGAELLCNSTSIGLEGTSVRWYLEMYPSYKLTLFLDSSVSRLPLLEELEAAVEVRDGGASLWFDRSMLRNNQHFYCLVFRGQDCLAFQNMYLPDRSEDRDVFASLGDRVVMNCPSDSKYQQWETPLGTISGHGATRKDQMHTELAEGSELFSLVIPAVSDEHSGDYSCTSSFLELEYSLVLCPKKDPKEKFVFEGGDVLLDCDVGKGDPQRIQWYRLESSGEHELIHDWDDDTVPVPPDLRGRLTLTDNDTSVAISNLQVRDLGVYWCLLLEAPEILEEDDYEDYDEDYSDEDDWPEVHRCVFKQETTLTLIQKTRTDVDLVAPTEKQASRNVETEITPEPSAASDVTFKAVGAGLACLLVVGVAVAAVFVIKRRRRTRRTEHKQGDAASRSGLTANKDVKMNLDPECTEKLTGGENA